MIVLLEYALNILIKGDIWCGPLQIVDDPFIGSEEFEISGRALEDVEVLTTLPD